MQDLGYYNGRYDRIENMTVPMNDRASYFGDGIYEAVYAHNHKLFALEEHMDRFYKNVRTLELNMPMEREAFTELLYELLGKVEGDDLLLYYQLTRGTQMRNHAPAEDLVGNIWVTVRPMKLKDIYTPMKLISRPDIRFGLCHIKTLNLLPAVLASREVDRLGVDECVFYKEDGHVTECAHSNVFILTDDHTLVTCPNGHEILPGVARAHLIAMAKKMGVKVEERHFSVEEMRNAAEVIVTASGTLCRPACELDGKPVGGRAREFLKPIQDALMAEFYEETRA